MTASTPSLPACPACARLHAARAASFSDDHLFIAELGESVAYLHSHQCLPGWCVLLLKDHAEHLSALPFARQTTLFHDVARVAAAINHVCSPMRFNYECLGNVMPHIHWHVVPRYEMPIDPDPTRAVWVQPASFLECGSDPGKAAALAAAIRGAMQ